jgi:small multidrug resistance pump
MGGWGWLGVAIVAEVVGTSALKAADGFQRLWPLALVVLAYGLSFAALSISLTSLPLGVAYAVWSGVGIVGASIVGFSVFGESLGGQQYAGIAVILAGVVIVNWPSPASP